MHSLFVADDDELFKRILKMTLVKYPLFKHVLYFENGRPLIRYLKENRHDRSNLPDILLLDLATPESGGWLVLDFLQTYYPTFAKPVLIHAISVSIDPRDRAKALRYDFVKDFIYKPLRKEQLIALADEAKIMAG